MTQILTLVSLLALAAGVAYWWYSRPQVVEKTVRVAVRLDRDAPGAHLIWEIGNDSDVTVNLIKLIVRSRHGRGEDVSLDLPRRLEPQDTAVVPTDVDWSLLAAKSIGVVAANGDEYRASPRELANIQEHLRDLIDRRAPTTSAREFLFGATDLAFGVVILGLGFFMLMWVIATG